MSKGRWKRPGAFPLGSLTGLGAVWLAASALSSAAPEPAGRPAYLDPDHAFEERAADLVARMTLEEKVAQMQNAAPAIPRLGVPAYDWWNEACTASRARDRRRCSRRRSGSPRRSTRR